MGAVRPRPWCCPEPRCTPLHAVQGGDKALTVAEPGESFVCFGAAPEVRYEYDGVVHENDTRSCHYTPLKGLIAYQENAEDWAAMRNGYWRALAALKSYREGCTCQALNPSSALHHAPSCSQSNATTDGPR